MGNYISWAREYLLKIVPDEDQIIKPEWIQYYDDLPIDNNKKITAIVTGVDLAISQRKAGDYTAIVSVAVFKEKSLPEVYVLPNMLNKKITFDATLKKVAEKHEQLKEYYGISEIFVENNGYQESAVQQLKNMGVPVKGVTSVIDKRARLSSVSHLFEQGKVFFPKKNADLLIRQLTGFGSEKHDDLSDALVIALENILSRKFNKIGMAIGDIHRVIPYDENFQKNKEEYELEKKIKYYERLHSLNERGFFL